MAERICAIESCDAAGELVRGWCRAHYQRWRRHGDPTAGNPTPRPSGGTCEAEECDRPAHARGWCGKHYHRWLEHGDPSLGRDRKPAPLDGLCSVDGCEQMHHAKGLCSYHYFKATWSPTPEQRETARKRAREWYWQDPERARRARIKYGKNNPDKIRALNHKRKASKRGASVSDLTASQWRQIKDVYGHRCVYCNRRMKRLTMDHVIPLARGGSHTASNVVPACRSCNLRKGVKPAPPYQMSLLLS